MRKAVSHPSRGMAGGRGAALLLTLAALTLTLACGRNTNFTAPTTSNPAPGVTLQNIKITPTNSIILLAETRQLYAMGTYSDGSTIDISSSVSWSVSPPPAAGKTSAVTVCASVNTNCPSVGLVTATQIGATAIIASLGGVTGALNLTVGTNGFSSSTIAILQVPYKTSEIDVAYFPQQTRINGAYAVQEVNVDADQFTTSLPVPVSLLASIAMPGKYVPNAAAASPSSSLVAVISYSSPDIQVIDASNNPLDVASNTIIATYKAPVSQSVKLNGTSCMICAAVVNPLNNQLILSTAQGFYSMNLTTGAFTGMQFQPPSPSDPPVAPSANFTVDPNGSPDPFILSVVPAAESNAGEIQILDLTKNTVTTYSNVSMAPAAGAIDLETQFAAIVDGSTNEQTLIDLTNPQTAVIAPVPGMGYCPGGGPAYMNMASLGVTAYPIAADVSHFLLTGQTGMSGQTFASCVGVAQWPSVGSVLVAANITYGYGPLPNAPDNTLFVMGSDPNAIATFTSVVNQNLYGLLVDGSQQWLAKMNLGPVAGASNGNPGGPFYLPAGTYIAPPPESYYLTAGTAISNITFLPTPSTQLTLSVSTAVPLIFGTVSVGQSSPQLTITGTNISGTAVVSPQVSIAGSNTDAFPMITNCNVPLQPLSKCTVNITFTPTAATQESAILNVAASGLPTQSVCLIGNPGSSPSCKTQP